MDKNKMLEELKRVVSGEETRVARADDEQVTAKVNAWLNPQSKRLVLDVVLTAKPGITIENFGNGLLFSSGGGKGESGANQSVRGWGVAEGHEIQSGLDTAVAGQGSLAGSWTVGTFVRTDTGYKMWTKSGKFTV